MYKTDYGGKIVLYDTVNQISYLISIRFDLSKTNESFLFLWWNAQFSWNVE